MTAFASSCNETCLACMTPSHPAIRLALRLTWMSFFCSTEIVGQKEASAAGRRRACGAVAKRELEAARNKIKELQMEANQTKGQRMI
ncbi:hypothetical protein ABZP36_009727 [Zizania latifolia]